MSNHLITHWLLTGFTDVIDVIDYVWFSTQYPIIQSPVLKWNEVCFSFQFKAWPSAPMGTCGSAWRDTPTNSRGRSSSGPPVAVPVTHSPHSKSWVRACIILPKECFLKCVADLIGNYDVEMPNPGNKSESESKLSLKAVLTISLLAALVLSLIFSGILIQCRKKSATKKGRNLMARGKCTLMSAN